MKKIFLIMLLGLAALSFPVKSYSEPEQILTEVLLQINDDQILAFNSLTNQWVGLQRKRNEEIVRERAHGNIAIIVTTYRILGFSAFTNEWASEDAYLSESLENFKVDGNTGIVATNKRTLGFSAHVGQWKYSK